MTESSEDPQSGETAPGPRSREARSVGVSRRSAPPPFAAAAPGEWNPFERVYAADGSLDRDYAAKRLPVLVDLLRRHPRCWPTRIDVERLGVLLLSDDAAPLRDASDQQAFEAALRRFSESHLHDLVDDAFHRALVNSLLEIARDPGLTRRDRAAAALGVALLSAPPDAHGVRGRGMLDLVLRVTLEEQTAQETLRKKARETEGGLSPEDLSAFWEQYPALRWSHEERYKREVAHVLRAVESDLVPSPISVDMGVRGAAKLLAEVARAEAEGRKIASDEAERILRTPFVFDTMDDGAALVVRRWREEIARPISASSDERRALLRTLEMGARIVEEQGPGADAVVFYLYLRAVVQGHYFVRDEADLEAAKSLFGPDGLVAEGAVSYAAHLARAGDPAGRHRVLLAALELWPDDEGVRAAAEAMGVAEEAAAKKARLGPRYEPAAGGAAASAGQGAGAEPGADSESGDDADDAPGGKARGSSA